MTRHQGLAWLAVVPTALAVTGDRTVETHVANVLIKLGLDSSAEGHRRVLAVLTFLEFRK